MDKMRDVAGITELMALQHMADPEVKGYGEKDSARLEALLRNRQELVQMIVVIRALSDADMLDADKIDELYAKAKELDND